MPRTPPKPAPRTNLWICLVLLAATFAVYFQTSDFAFVNYDDPEYVTANPHVRDGLTVDGIGWAFTSGEAANWFPVTRLSHMLDVQLFGLNAGAHHLVNVVIHAAAVLLLFAFLFSATRARWPSAFVALLFAVHPLHVESVAWVAERKDVLSAFFWFLALWMYVRYTAQPTGRRYAALLAAFCLGLMAKPMIVTLPFLLLILDFWPLRRGLALREKAPLFALSAVSAAITYTVQKGSGAVEGLAIFPLALRLENGAVTYWTYMIKTVLPTRMAAFYPYPLSLPEWQPIAAFAGLLGVTALVWFRRREQPYLLAGWLWFVGTLVPVIGLVQAGFQARADRYMYVPMVGLAIMVAFGAADLVRRIPRARTAVAVAGGLVCAACIPVAWTQTSYWHDSETLFRHALAVTGDNAIAEHNLGSALLDTPSRLPEAVAHLQAALRLNPDSASTHSDLGTAFARMGRVGEAVSEFQTALRLKPDSPVIRANLQNAQKELTADTAEAHYSKGVDLSNSGRLQDAVAEFEQALRMRPDYAEAQNNLGVTLTQIPGHAAEALPHFQAAVKLNPNYADAHFNLGVALAQMPGRLPEAVHQLEEAYRLHPDPELKQTLDRLRSGQ
ncbi:MAG TPA: tetratricopeptide repeat protein [Candidatus Sulfopaludibacter sp.]|nr:tetratricopeptide repeat protein [Candidatus Sulfopaludibacter sp.]